MRVNLVNFGRILCYRANMLDTDKHELCMNATSVKLLF